MSGSNSIPQATYEVKTPIAASPSKADLTNLTALRTQVALQGVGPGTGTSRTACPKTTGMAVNATAQTGTMVAAAGNGTFTTPTTITTTMTGSHGKPHAGGDAACGSDKTSPLAIGALQ